MLELENSFEFRGRGRDKLDKLSAIESRMEDNFSNPHTQIAELSTEFKLEIAGVKSTLNALEKSLVDKHPGLTARV